MYYSYSYCFVSAQTISRQTLSLNEISKEFSFFLRVFVPTEIEWCSQWWCWLVGLLCDVIVIRSSSHTMKHLEMLFWVILYAYDRNKPRWPRITDKPKIPQLNWFHCRTLIWLAAQKYTDIIKICHWHVIYFKYLFYYPILLSISDTWKELF